MACTRPGGAAACNRGVRSPLGSNLVVDIPLVVPHQDATAIQQPPERRSTDPPRLPAAWTSLVARSRVGRSPTMVPIVAFEGLQSGTFARAVAAPRTGNPEPKGKDGLWMSA